MRQQSSEISKNMRDFLKEEIIKTIEQAHQATTANRNSFATLALPCLVVKITNWDMPEKN